MKINIVCSEYPGAWIYSKFVNKIALYSKHKIYINGKEKCAVTHVIPYYDVSGQLKSPVTAWFSHMESKQPLKDKFLSAAKQCSWCMSPSIKYMDLLLQNGITNVSQVQHGVDLNIFKPLGVCNKSSKLVVGAVGRSYSSTSRKNEQLLQKIAKLDFVDFRFTGGKVKEEDMPRWINECDILTSASTIEGGPMIISEGLACGKPILCYAGVGVADEFEHGVIKVSFNDEAAFIKRLLNFWQNKEAEAYKEQQKINLLRSQVETQTWERFVKNHDDIWDMVASK